MSTDRTAEIWSTRLQRELLALTSDDSGGDEKEEKDAVGVIPPFVKVQDHELNVEEGTCRVTFRIEVGEELSSPKGEGEKAQGEADAEAEAEADAKEAENAAAAALSESAYVALTLDASLTRTPDGKVKASPSSYPFQAPGAYLITGAAYFPEGSKIDDGDRLDIDLDWTPSLHLNDAVLHVGLRVRECIRRGEPFDRAEDGMGLRGDQAGREALAATAARVDEAAEAAKKQLGAFWGNFKARASVAAAAIDNAVAPRQSPTRPPSASTGAAADAAGSEVAPAVAADASNEALVPPAAAAAAPGAAVTAVAQPRRSRSNPASAPAGSVRIGDEINLAESPWNLCAGMYTCKAIRRPAYVEEAMERARREREAQVRGVAFGDHDEDEDLVPYGPGNYMGLQAGSVRKVAGAGVVGAGSLFKSFTASAKSVLEESLLMITEDLIIELRTNKFTLSSGTVTFVTPISSLAKLKFRRQESISLFFKPAPSDPIIYMCPDSADCVQQIQTVLKRHGVRGKHTNAATQRSIQTALSIVSEIQRRERDLESDATVGRVNEIMDLYRQAAEKFEQAGDPRHEEVMDHMRKFLAKPLTVSILDGSYQKPSLSNAAGSIPQGEILEGTRCQLEDGDGDGDVGRSPVGRSSPDHVSSLLRKTDDITEEVKRDLATLGADSDLDGLMTPSAGGDEDKAEEDEKDSFAELDAMLSAADKELTDILNA